MSVVVVGYVPHPRGRAALEHALLEAHRRDALLVVVNSSRGDALVDEEFLRGDQLRALHDELAASGLRTRSASPSAAATLPRSWRRCAPRPGQNCWSSA